MKDPTPAIDTATRDDGPASIQEPAEGTIVCWFDPNGDLYAVFHRTWKDLLGEMNGFRGPVELISNGRLGGAS